MLGADAGARFREHARLEQPRPDGRIDRGAGVAARGVRVQDVRDDAARIGTCSAGTTTVRPSAASIAAAVRSTPVDNATTSDTKLPPLRRPRSTITTSPRDSSASKFMQPERTPAAVTSAWIWRSISAITAGPNAPGKISPTGTRGCDSSQNQLCP